MNTVDEYLEKLEDDQKSQLERIRNIARDAISDSEGTVRLAEIAK